MRAARAVCASFILASASCGGSSSPEAPDAAVLTDPAPIVVARSSKIRFDRVDGLLAARIEEKRGPTKHRAVVSLPSAADGTFTVRAPGVAVRARLISAASVSAQLEGDRVVYPRAVEGADLIHAPSEEGTEEWVKLAAKPKENVLRWSFSTEGIAGLRLAGGVLEMVDASGDPRLRVRRPVLFDAQGTRREGELSVEGCAVDREIRHPWGRTPVAPGAAACTLIVRWNDQDLAYPLMLDPAWTTTGSLAYPRQGHGAAPLKTSAGTCSTGCVVVVNGWNGTAAQWTPELYNVATGTWSAIPSGTVGIPGVTDMAMADASNGTVLVAGGFTDASKTIATAKSSYYGPATGWAQAGDLDVPRAQMGVASITNWGVLLSGGYSTTSVRALDTNVFWYRNGTATPYWIVPTAAYKLPTARRSPVMLSQIWSSSTGCCDTRFSACVAGGRDGGAGTGTALLTADCATFDPKTSFYDYTTWTAATGALSVSRTAGAVVNGNAYLRSSQTASTGNTIDRLAMSVTFGGPVCTPFCAFYNLTGPLSGATVLPRAATVAAPLGDRVIFTGGSGLSLGGTSGWWDVDYVLPSGSSAVTTLGNMNVAHVNHTATPLPDGRVLVAGGIDGAGATTGVTEIIGLVAKGGTCAVSGECTGMLSCVAGVCCDTTGSASGCSGTCESCTAPGSVGTCVATPLGNPRDGKSCGSGTVGAPCGLVCDGANRTACAYPGATYQCSAKSCTGTTLTNASFCPPGTPAPASSVCPVAATSSCAGYKCNVAGTDCLTACAASSDCAPGYGCKAGKCETTGGAGSTCTDPTQCTSGNCVDGRCCTSASCPSGQYCDATTNGVCAKRIGATCTGASDCGSGFCVDGYCCNRACNGICEQCNGSSKGTCSLVPAGIAALPAHGSCGAASGNCEAKCDGTNATVCGPPAPKGQGCGAASCNTSTSTAQDPSQCDGAGTCVAGATHKCSVYKCGTTDCKTTCASTADCQSGYFCDTTTSTCTTSGDPGTACSDPTQCKSGNCVDGACCTTASCPSGQTCSAKGNGTCSKPLGSTCTTNTECGSGSCADGVCCDGPCTGTCESCKLAGKIGQCLPVPSGSAAAHGACAGSGACQSKCDGTTRASCGPLPGISTVCAAASCVTDATTNTGKYTGASYCDGLGVCVAPASASCIAYACSSSSACGVACTASTDCAKGYACKAGKCETTGALGTACDDGTQCKSGRCVVSTLPGVSVCCSVESCPVGTFCGDATSATPGACVKKSGSTCSDPNECSSGFCVDGVCCESACTGQCESCATPGALGRCAAVNGAPLGAKKACESGGADVCKALECDGTDRTKCARYVNGPSKECARSCGDDGTVALSFCDGAGACGAPRSTSCSGFRCDAGACKTGCTANSDCTSGFYCNPKTSKCEPALGKCNDQRTQSTSADGTQVLDCAPYKCDPGSGGCGKQCASSENDCAIGFLCSEGACVPAPSGESDDSGGCSYGGTSKAGPVSLLFAVLAGFAARRRRS